MHTHTEQLFCVISERGFMDNIYYYNKITTTETVVATKTKHNNNNNNGNVNNKHFLYIF